jgi:hypothetical protein
MDYLRAVLRQKEDENRLLTTSDVYEATSWANSRIANHLLYVLGKADDLHLASLRHFYGIAHENLDWVEEWQHRRLSIIQELNEPRQEKERLDTTA